jgi:hypothetical protein
VNPRFNPGFGVLRCGLRLVEGKNRVKEADSRGLVKKFKSRVSKNISKRFKFKQRKIHASNFKIESISE